jgi:hypothetical protein
MRIDITFPGELLAAIERIDQDHSAFIKGDAATTSRG